LKDYIGYIFNIDPIHVAIEKQHCKMTSTKSNDNGENVLSKTWNAAVEGVETILSPVVEEGKEILEYVENVEEGWVDKVKSFFYEFQ